MRLAVLPAVAATLLAAAPPVGASPPEEEVRLHLRLSSRPHGTTAEREQLRVLEYDVTAALEAARAGEFVRDEWPGGECVVYLAGPDARAIWSSVEETVRAYRPRPGSYAALRARGREERVELGAR